MRKVEKDKIIEKLEMITRKVLIIFTPRGFVPFSYGEELPENIYQEHLAGYIIEDFRNNNFSIRGIGCRWICNKWYKEGKLPIWLRRFVSALSLLSTGITYFILQIAEHLFCVKYLNKDKR